MQKFYYYWGRVAIVLLMFHAAYGLWESFKFLIIDYPELETLLNEHLLTTTQVTNITITGIVLMVTTLITIMMALRLHAFREQVSNTVDLLMATVIIVATPAARIWLSQLPWDTWLQSFF